LVLLSRGAADGWPSLAGTLDRPPLWLCDGEWFDDVPLLVPAVVAVADAVPDAAFPVDGRTVRSDSDEPDRLPSLSTSVDFLPRSR